MAISGVRQRFVQFTCRIWGFFSVAFFLGLFPPSLPPPWYPSTLSPGSSSQQDREFVLGFQLSCVVLAGICPQAKSFKKWKTQCHSLLQCVNLPLVSYPPVSPGNFENVPLFSRVVTCERIWSDRGYSTIIRSAYHYYECRFSIFTE